MRLNQRIMKSGMLRLGNQQRTGVDEVESEDQQRIMIDYIESEDHKISIGEIEYQQKIRIDQIESEDQDCEIVGSTKDQD